jgi:hypothetical protein
LVSAAPEVCSVLRREVAAAAAVRNLRHVILTPAFISPSPVEIRNILTPYIHLHLSYLFSYSYLLILKMTLEVNRLNPEFPV